MKKATLRCLWSALALVAGSTLQPQAGAAEATVDDASPPAARIDRWHDWLYVKVQGWAQGLDQRFVREGEVEEATPPTAFRISSDAELVNHSDGGVKFGGKLDIDLLLQLRNLEKRLKIFVTSDTVEESPDRGTEERRLRAGARFALKDYFNFDVGVRIDVPPVAFTAVRWQRQLELGSWDVEPFAKVYLETKKGLGAASGVTFDHWSNRWLVRASTYANWRNDESATAWTQTLLVAHAREILRFGRYGSIVRGTDLVRAYGVQALVSGEKTSGADTYELSVFAKQPTARNWLYWHVTPLVRWERDYGWHADPGIRAGIDILFWDLSDR
jgi:hypothetical protein